MPGTNILALPAINISSFLSAQHTESAPKRLREAKKYKAICNACKSFTLAKSDDPHNPDFIPFLRNGEKIEVGHKFDDELEPMSGLYLSRHVARLKDGIPNPKERPTLPLPWSLAFMFLIFPNSEIKEEEIYNLFVEGGLAIGFGTYRGCFGKFEVVKWE
jgi:hypothetical protein